MSAGTTPKGVEVQTYAFPLEDGQYSFSFLNKYVDNGVFVFGTDLKMPSENSLADNRLIDNEDRIRLYALAGDRTWIEEVSADMENYALEREIAYEKTMPTVGKNTQINVDAVAPEKKIQEQANETQELSQSAFTESEGNSQEKNEKKQWFDMVPSLIKGILAFLFLGFVYWLFIYHREIK